MKKTLKKRNPIAHVLRLSRKKAGAIPNKRKQLIKYKCRKTKGV